MANIYTDMPIVIDTVMASGWKASQAAATFPIFKTAAGAVGIKPVKVLWTGIPTTLATQTFVIQDSLDSTLVLLQGQYISGATTNNVPDQEYDMEVMNVNWRDFKVTTLSAGKLLIWYRF
jgi:hypothetical protein